MTANGHEVSFMVKEKALKLGFWWWLHNCVHFLKIMSECYGLFILLQWTDFFLFLWKDKSSADDSLWSWEHKKKKISPQKKSHEKKISYSSYSDGWGMAILPFLRWVMEGIHHYLKPRNRSLGQYILPSTSISWVYRWWKLHSCRFAVNTIWALTKPSPATALGSSCLSLVCVPP